MGDIIPIIKKLHALYDMSPSAYPWAQPLQSLASRMTQLQTTVAAAILKHGVMQFQGNRVYAYEVDGFGNSHFMDDANVPSLLSMPFLGFTEIDDPLYQNTRQAILSHNNPWYA